MPPVLPSNTMKVLPGCAGSAKVYGSRNAKPGFWALFWYSFPSGSSSLVCWKPSKVTPFWLAWMLPSALAITASGAIPPPPAFRSATS
ncbi:hypothetical protein D3C73_1273610 [compost metagenome]